MEIENFKISEFGAPYNKGVYAIWSINYPYKGCKHLLYIGSSKNINKRINNETHPYRIAFNRLNGSVFTSFIEVENYKEIEKNLIIKYKPILNKQWR